jgi:hypothetical protein
MAIRMEKVAALRQLFAEYGYSSAGANDGMDKEAANRLTKFLNRVGLDKYNAAWNKALDRVKIVQGDRDNKSRLTPYYSSSYYGRKGHEKLPAMQQSFSARARNAEQAYRALSHTVSRRDLLDERYMKLYGNHLLSMPRGRLEGDTLKAWRKWHQLKGAERRAKRVAASPRPPAYKALEYYNKLIKDSEPLPPRRKGHNWQNTPTAATTGPVFLGRYMGTGATPAQVLSRYQSFMPEAPTVRVRNTPVLTRLFLDFMHNRSLSNSRLKALSGGLIDKVKAMWRGIFNPSGTALGESVFGDGKYRHVGALPSTAWKYGGGSHLGSYNSPRYDRIRNKPNMLAGIAQSKPVAGSVDWVREQAALAGDYFGGYTELDKPVYMPDYSIDNLLIGKTTVEKALRERRGLSKYERWKARVGSKYENWDNPSHEAYVKSAPGGERSYLEDWFNNFYDPVDPAELAAARRATILGQVKWYRDMVSNKVVQNMLNSGLLRRADVRRNIPIVGTNLSVEPGRPDRDYWVAQGMPGFAEW